jgi:hypothetical protein
VAYLTDEDLAELVELQKAKKKGFSEGREIGEGLHNWNEFFLGINNEHIFSRPYKE